jgi:hypothetical protein
VSGTSVEGLNKWEGEKRGSRSSSKGGSLQAGRWWVEEEEKLTRHGRGARARRKWEGKSLFVDAHMSGT